MVLPLFQIARRWPTFRVDVKKCKSVSWETFLIEKKKGVASFSNDFVNLLGRFQPETPVRNLGRVHKSGQVIFIGLN